MPQKQFFPNATDVRVTHAPFQSNDFCAVLHRLLFFTLIRCLVQSGRVIGTPTGTQKHVPFNYCAFSWHYNKVLVFFWHQTLIGSRKRAFFFASTQIPNTHRKQCDAYLRCSLLPPTHSNGWRSTMVSSRSGPVETISTGTPQTFAIRSK